MDPQPPQPPSATSMFTPIRAIYGLLHLVIGLIEFFISVRILLKLLGANPVAPFVAWVYDMTAPLLAPFEGMFPSPVLTRGLVIEFSALFALLAYAFVGYFLHQIVDYISTQLLGPKKPDNLPPKPTRTII